MLISNDRRPSDEDFRRLVLDATTRLNAAASERPRYYAKHGGSPLEDDVAEILTWAARGTPFEGSIRKVSGRWFPDITAGKYHGVEVKSTQGDHWTSVGSSIVESSRIPDVRRIWLTFGKLGGEVPEFRSRPYEECLSGIAVTHSPRYQIDMRIGEGETIFDRMNVTYDELRSSDDPARRVAAYYRKIMRPGERLWWTGDLEDDSAPAQVRLWKIVDPQERRRLTVYGLVNFPEVFASNFERYVLWLVRRGIVTPNARDIYTSGGQEPMRLRDESVVKMPGIFRRVNENFGLILRRLRQTDPTEYDGMVDLAHDHLGSRFGQWATAVARESSVNENMVLDALSCLYVSKPWADV